MTRKMQDEEDDGGGGRVQRGNEPRDWGLTGRSVTLLMMVMVEQYHTASLEVLAVHGGEVRLMHPQGGKEEILLSWTHPWNRIVQRCCP